MSTKTSEFLKEKIIFIAEFFFNSDDYITTMNDLINELKDDYGIETDIIKIQNSVFISYNIIVLNNTIHDCIKFGERSDYIEFMNHLLISMELMFKMSLSIILNMPV
jgi:hypothetical protein